MTALLKQSALALLITAAAVATQAETTNLLQAVNVDFAVYSQGTPSTNADGDVQNIVDESSFKTGDLIAALTGSPPNSGDILVRATPVTNASPTNGLGPAMWAIYNKHTTPKLTPINTNNVYFDIHTDLVYQDGTNTARIHGEIIRPNGEIKYGVTDEIRTLILSNSTWQIQLRGYSHGHVVPVSLGDTASATVVYSSDYTWTGSGSGVNYTNSVYFVMDGGITEDYINLLKE